MKHLATALLLLVAATALAAGSSSLPELLPADHRASGTPVPDKALGDPNDFQSPALAGADYLVMMQADVSEVIDNAGNGLVDTDPDDGGWDWNTTAFSHSTSPSPMNLYGVTALGMYNTYLIDPQPSHLLAMQEAADQMVAIGPDPGVRSASDVIFLLKFADLPDCPSPAAYLAGAQAIWDRHINVYGTMVALAEFVRDYRAGSYPNGIIPWDIGAWAAAAMLMDAAFPGNGHAAEGVGIAEVLYQDSFNGTPGYFEPFGHSQGYDPAWDTVDYWWYTLGLTGLIQAFETTGTHTAELPALQAALLACQYPDGSFSDQYGAQGGDADTQTSAYALATLAEYLPIDATSAAAIRDGANWLAATQHSSGGWVDGSGVHYPEVGGESTTGLALAAAVTDPAVGVGFSGPDPATCGLTKTATVSYTPGEATPGIRGFEVVFEVTGGVGFAVGDIDEGPALDSVSSAQFYAVDNGDGTFTATGAILGATPGLLVAGDLFSVDLVTNADGPVTFDILSVDLRDPDNAPVFADVTGGGFDVDCTEPAAVTTITASPAHEEVVVTWAHDDVDVDHYAVFRGLWYDTSVGTSAYPEYDDLAGDVIPTRPADYAAALASAEWTPAGTAPAGTFTFTDAIGPRGVYYYEVFAVDAATNGSAAAAANDRATNYWLGDFDGDGDVDIEDVTALGNSFGLADGTPGLVDPDWDDDTFVDNTQDVGPTYDMSSFGIPTTDNMIQFEDLIVVAINFGEVAAKSQPDASGHVQLAWTRIDATHWGLDLVDGAGLKGLRLTANVPVSNVAAGELLSGQDAPFFLRNLGSNLDANLALLGNGEGIVGTGRLLVVQTSVAVDEGQLTVDARDLANNGLEVLFKEVTGVTVPQAFSLDANYPNPFNPQTTIVFALPQAEDVRLSIYSLDGRLVRTLINAARSAGNHEVTWNGRDDAGRPVATGTYMYVIDAGAHHQTRKMSLIK